MKDVIIDKANEHQNIILNPNNLCLVNAKWGEIRQKFDDDDIVEEIDDNIKNDLMFLQLPESTNDEEKIIEVSFSKLTKKNNKNNYTVIQRAIPRLYRFK